MCYENLNRKGRSAELDEVHPIDVHPSQRIIEYEPNERKFEQTFYQSKG